MKLNNKRIWVTGASSGIGRAMAYRLSQVASVLIISGIEEEDLMLMKNDLESDETIVEAIVFDLGDIKQVENAANIVNSKFGGVDVLINNGGISQRSLVEETELFVDRRIMEVNFFGQIQLTRLMLPGMISQQSGHIAVTSSMVGKFGFPLRSSYSASKHALQGYFETAGLELKRYGIRVTIACPGRIRTNISLNAVSGTGEKYGQMDPGQAYGMSAEKCADKYIRAITNNKWEVYIGKNEILMIWIKRFAPWLFRRLALRVSSK